MEPLELTCVAAWSFAVAVAGGIAGLVLGNLRLPVVLQFSTSAAAGAGANVAISAASAFTASIAHWHGGRIDWRLFWLMAPPSLVGGIVGGLVSGVLPQRLLLATIAIVVLYGAVELIKRQRRPPPERPPAGGWAVAVTIAFAVGVLGGLVGLILGTLRLPAMVKWLGTAPKAAVGTNAATGVVVGIGGLIGHIAGGVDWNLLAAGCIGAVPGAYLGAHLTGRLDDQTLLQVIAAILVVAGIALGIQAAVSGGVMTDEPLRLGGMALRNGLLIHGPTHWAAAVRDPDGKIQVASERKPELAPKLAAKVPGLRGPLRLAEAFAVLPLTRRRLPAARLPFEDWRVLAAIGMTLAATAALRKRLGSSALREGVVQAIGATPAVVALLDRDLAAYHGVEHKAIAAYEQGVEDPAGVPKEHDRCGSNLVAPMMLLSVAGTVLLERLVERPGPLARAAVGLGGASLAVEMFAWSDRHHGEPLAEAFHRPGREIQRHLATREPTPDQLEVGVAALSEILRAEQAGGAGDEPPPAT